MYYWINTKSYSITNHQTQGLSFDVLHIKLSVLPPLCYCCALQCVIIRQSWIFQKLAWSHRYRLSKIPKSIKKRAFLKKVVTSSEQAADHSHLGLRGGKTQRPSAGWLSAAKHAVKTKCLTAEHLRRSFCLLTKIIKKQNIISARFLNTPRTEFLIQPNNWQFSAIITF